MNDAEFDVQRARLSKLADEWVRPIGLGWWKVDLAYDRDGADFADSVVRDHSFFSGSAARCYADWRYGIATIVWNMPHIATVEDEELEHLFVHELMHIFLSEMREGANVGKQLPHEERVCTTLEKAFIWTRDRARDGKWGEAE